MLIAQAEQFFKEGRYIQSAQCYAQSSASFEEVTLNLIDAGEREALRYYLISRLERTRKTVRVLGILTVHNIYVIFQDLIQRMMLATWLVELYLSRCNELEDVAASESVSHDFLTGSDQTFLKVNYL